MEFRCTERTGVATLCPVHRTHRCGDAVSGAQNAQVRRRCVRCTERTGAATLCPVHRTHRCGYAVSTEHTGAATLCPVHRTH
ncbi:hypothetical protein BgiMline_016657, partial [Biomphalaria glabrata]